jgi:hypothetical protein
MWTTNQNNTTNEIINIGITDNSRSAENVTADAKSRFSAFV